MINQRPLDLTCCCRIQWLRRGEGTCFFVTARVNPSASIQSNDALPWSILGIGWLSCIPYVVRVKYNIDHMDITMMALIVLNLYWLHWLHWLIYVIDTHLITMTKLRDCQPLFWTDTDVRANFQRSNPERVSVVPKRLSTAWCHDLRKIWGLVPGTCESESRLLPWTSDYSLLNHSSLTPHYWPSHIYLSSPLTNLTRLNTCLPFDLLHSPNSSYLTPRLAKGAKSPIILTLGSTKISTSAFVRWSFFSIQSFFPFTPFMHFHHDNVPSTMHAGHCDCSNRNCYHRELTCLV